MAVTYRRIPSTDPRLARHVRHDDRSRAYAFDTSGLSIVSAKHTRRIPVLDQGNLGSCTGNAGIGCLGTDPFYDTITGSAGQDVKSQSRTGHVLGCICMACLRNRLAKFALNEQGAVDLYSAATQADDYPGSYPPDDTGSDGLTVAKVLQRYGEISGYQHTFNLDDALKALGVTPFITGTNWYSTMFDPDQDGRVYPTGTVAGGHEYVADEIDATNEQVWFTNSWGQWGVTRDGRQGRFYMTFADYGDLLSQQGDVTIFTPLTQPAPQPTPPADPDAALAAVAHHWVAERHIGENHKMANALNAWMAAKGL